MNAVKSSLTTSLEVYLKMPGVPALYRTMYARRVFTSEEAARVTGLEKRLLVRQLSYLQAEGYLDQVRRGLYAVIPLESRPEPSAVSPYLVAAKLVEPYVLSYHTGLELHGVAQSAFNRVFVATPRRFEPFEYQGVTYQRVRAKEREVGEAVTQVTVEDQPVFVATREWTVAHCTLRLDLAGGLEELLKCVANVAHLDPAKLHAAATTLGRKVLFNRLGFLLSLHREKWSVSDQDLRRFRDRMSQAPSYFGAKRGRGRYVKDWHLMVPENLEQVMRPA